MTITTRRSRLLTSIRTAGLVTILASAAAPDSAAGAFSPCRDPEFGQAAHYRIGDVDVQYALITADVNGDTRPDLILPVGIGGVAAMLNMGKGQFAPAILSPTGGVAVLVAAADFTSDGRPDLVVVNQRFYANDPPEGVVLLRNLGSGMFAAPQAVLGSQVRWSSVAVGDVNRDGNLDLVFGTRSLPATRPPTSPSPVVVLLGNGAGGFGTPISTFVGISQGSVALGDFNNDSLPDLVVVTDGSADEQDRIVVLLGTGTGRFVPRWSSTPSSKSESQVVLGYLNRDDHLDMAVEINGRVGFYLGTGTGVFRGEDGGGFTASEGIAIGDVTGDGVAEVAHAVWEGAGRVVVRLGPGRFDAHHHARFFAVQQFPTAVVIEDLDGDGRRDVAAANSRSDSVSILLNTCDGLVVGGRGLTLRSSGSGNSHSVSMSWWRGDLQAGYHVVRRIGNTNTVLTTPPLPRDALHFTDPAPVARETNCYTVAPLSATGAVLGLSDMLCVQPQTGNGTTPSISLNQSHLMTFSPSGFGEWPGPIGWVQLNALPMDGSSPAPAEIGLYTGRHDTRGVTTCYTRVTGTGAAVQTISDVFCVVPGVATLGTASGSQQ